MPRTDNHPLASRNRLALAVSSSPASLLRALAVAALSLLIATLGSNAARAKQDEEVDEPSSFKEALAEGKGKVSLRYRFELVDQDNIKKEAEASTLRTTVSYASAPYKGWTLFVEAENVSTTDDDAYRNAGGGSLFNGVTDRPVVADPEITEIDQAFVQYRNSGWTVQAGRRGFNVDTQRFVGTVAWRQNHQSFDSVSFAKTLGDGRTTLSYTYIDRINRIFGDTHQMGSDLLTGDFKLDDKASLHAFVLDLDYDDVLALSTTTVGARLFGTTGITYSVAFATQSDSGDNPATIDANYYNAEIGGTLGSVQVLGGYEVLEGSASEGKFSTPLATLHKFNGWADQFLATPADGLEDLYLSLSGKFDPSFAWVVVYHDFAAESSSRNFGSEIDAQITYGTKWGQSFGLKAALYDADEHNVDTDKLFFFTSYGFGN